MLYLDTETCGLVGPIVLIQYAYDDSKPILHEVWKVPIRQTLKLIERICEENVCGFNLSYDWFHLVKLYNTLHGCYNLAQPPNIEEAAERTHQNYSKFAIRPRGVIDLFLHARKTEFQSLMERRPIVIRKVPITIAYHLAKLLHNKIPLDPIYFQRKELGYYWNVKPIDDMPDLADIELIFAASTALKSLITHIFKEVTYEFPIPKELWPEEYSWNPLNTSWTKVIQAHIELWAHNKTARVYAENDIIYLQRLYSYFNKPEVNDVDSELAICVGNCRWLGFNVDIDALLERQKYNIDRLATIPTAPSDVKDFLKKQATPLETILIKNTARDTLDSLSNLQTPLGIAAKQVIEAREAEKELDVLNKLFITKRFFPDFKVIGARSFRMSGGSDEGIIGGSINPQGINREPGFRKIFTFANSNDVFSGGDFDSFEVTIADAVYNDNTLHSELVSGRKLHGILGSFIYDKTYEEVMESKKLEGLFNLYNPAKNCVFGLFYGAQAKKLGKTARRTEEHMQQVLTNFETRFPGVGRARQLIKEAFCSMVQPDGIGTAILWRDPAEYIESLCGDRRYYTLENYIVKQLFKLAQFPPPEFNIIGEITRTNRKQTIQGALQSALYACCFQIQAANMRSAANHVIQSTGGRMTKIVQCNIWRLQPVGVKPWLVKPINIHDEICCVHEPLISDKVQQVVMDTVESFRPIVPLIKMDWKIGLKNWSEK